MDENIKNNNENQETRNNETAQQEPKKAAPIPLSMLSKGTLELATPIRSRSEDVTKLHYDFTKLTGWEYVEAMDSDPNNRNVFNISKKQAICLFAAAAAKCTEGLDVTDIKERIGLADAMRAVQVATAFLVRSAQEAGKNTFGE